MADLSKELNKELSKDFAYCEDTISRQAAIDALHMHLIYRMGTDSNKKRLDDWINGVPSAQPEIIACGDCIHWICHDRRCGYWNHGVKPLDWCCHAERRTNE